MDAGGYGVEPIRECGWAWLQDQWRFDFEKRAGLDGRDLIEACAGTYVLRPKSLATPRAKNDFWLSSDDLLDHDNPPGLTVADGWCVISEVKHSEQQLFAHR